MQSLYFQDSKHEPLVDEVEFLEANPDYAHIRFPDGQEDSVSLSHFAPEALWSLHQEI